MKTLLQLLVVALVTGALTYGVLSYLRPHETAAIAPEVPVPETFPLSPQAERGSQLATELGCSTCHSLDGSQGIGPSWLGANGTLRVFTDGSSFIADEAYLRRSMLEPAELIVQGYQNIMLPAQLSEAQIADLLALIRELSPTQQ